MKKRILTLLLMGSLVLFSGCYPDGAENTSDLDVVYSAYDKTYSFQNAATYSLPDKIVILDESEEPDFISDVYGMPILNEVDAHMQALGWTKVDNANNPDVQILPASWTTTTISYWGGGYWCYWDPYYCSGGGWYYPYPVVSSYTTGTLLWVMVDNASTSVDGKKRVVWTAAMNGLFQGGYDANRINKAIDQAFKQSQYLKTN